MVTPLADLLPNVERIIKTNASIASGWIGVHINDLDPEGRQAYKSNATQGILVTDVIKGSSAEKSGLQAGDVIQQVDQQVIGDIQAFTRRIQNTPPGKTVNVRVLRGSAAKDLPVLVAKRHPESYSVIEPSYLEINLPEITALMQSLEREYRQRWLALSRSSKTAGARTQGFQQLEAEYATRQKEIIESHLRAMPARPTLATMGVVCQDLSPQLAQYFGVKEGRGALVDSVMPLSPAEVVGIKAGDVIVKLSDKKIAHCAEVARDMQKRRVGQKIKVSLLRKEKPVDLYVTLAKANAPGK